MKKEKKDIVKTKSPQIKQESKFVRVTREEALKNRVHTYPYFIN